jgi:hypothetical protein
MWKERAQSRCRCGSDEPQSRRRRGRVSPVPAQMWQRWAQSRCRCGSGGPSPGADVAAVSPVPVQMWQRWAQSRCRCGSGEPSPGADVAAVSPRVTWACVRFPAAAARGSSRFGFVCSVSADAAESSDELELYMREMSRSERQSREQARPSHICTETGHARCPHLHRDWARRCHICSGTGLTLPHLHRDWARPLPTSAPGLGSPLPHLHRDWASPLPHRHRDLARPATSAPVLGSPHHSCCRTGLTPPHLHRDCRP